MLSCFDGTSTFLTDLPGNHTNAILTAIGHTPILTQIVRDFLSHRLTGIHCDSLRLDFRPVCCCQHNV